VINLRFDTEEGAKADLGGRRAIVPGDLNRSEMYRRITATDESIRMPPLHSGRKLTDHQIDLIRQWIEQGAQWEKHWSLVPPRKPEIPKPYKSTRVYDAIDHFVLERLETEGLGLSPEADRETLIRRVTLDLTGLPPTLEEVDAFLGDRSADAYEKVVDRLLASPRYGERMAARWLDGARYADTNGYQSDGERFMWRWRDWVIEAFNRNMPFDRFTVEQIAGDMLPSPTLDQRIATGFNRNHRGNAEGGIIPEEYAVEYVVDRVDTTFTVWLGLTVGCARCHDHKYDPISQKEFYRLFAYFNNVPERGKAIKYGNSPPMIKAPTPEQQERLRGIEQKLAAVEKKYAVLEGERKAAQAVWERSLDLTRKVHWAPTDGLVAHYPLDPDGVGDSPATAKSEPAAFENAAYVLGRIGQAADFDGRRYVLAGNVGDFGFYDKFSLSAWVFAKGEPNGAIMSRMTETARSEGYSLYVEKGRVQLNLSKRWLDDALRVETEARLTPGRWHHVLATYDGSRVSEGIRIYLDGEPQELRVLLDDLNQSFKTREPFRIGSLGGEDGRFQGFIDEVRVYVTALTAEEAELLANSDSIADIAAIPSERRSQQQRRKIETYFLERHASEGIQQARRELLALRRERDRFVESIPTTMVMEEMPKPRETFVLVRGAYDKPGEKVSPGIPPALPPLPAGAPNNRLGFSRWLVDPSNPLTARVAVNRFWQMYFGTALVKTVDDFGAQGEWPTHPRLLDWLATEFMQTGWNIKALQKTIVMSATYRQSSKANPELLQKDPENRLLARGPRLRLPAEMVRDQALAVSGLLVEKLGGPSVRPYQPAGLWKELTGGEDYKPDHGENLYRRSLYTFWKRTIPPPAMTTFDAPARETCIVRETRTNTPLQALALMNDVTYVEAARALAERIMTEGGTTPVDRITRAFRLATGRKPRGHELTTLAAAFETYRNHYRSDPEAARKLLTVGDSPRNEKLDAAEQAGYTLIASSILNLDEVITKQ
jgi:hypothetical protein